ncbi:hypothetical protein ACIBM4_35065 [Streptomyces sp. NPDC050256]
MNRFITAAGGSLLDTGRGNARGWVAPKERLISLADQAAGADAA